MINMIKNPVKFPGTMPKIFSEIFQFGNPHATLNHFQGGVPISDFLILVDFWLFSKKTVLVARTMNTTMAILLLASSAHPSTPGKDAAMTPTQSLPRHLSPLHPPLLRMVGLQGHGGNDDNNVDPRGNDDKNTAISLG